MTQESYRGTRTIYSGYRVGKPDGGPDCERLERELESYYSVPHARVLNSATSAIHGALAALGVRAGEVIVSAYSMSASASAVLHADAEVVFADIGEDYCLDWSAIDRLISSRTRAIVLVHLFGHHSKVPDGITVPVVHDCAQSPTVRPADHCYSDDAEYARPREERMHDIFCYSLNQWKVVTCGEGGYALTYDKALADKIHAVRNHGECYTEDILGWNYRMTEMQARVALNEFRQLDSRIAERRRWAGAMSALYGIRDDGNRDYFLFPVRTKPADRSSLAERLHGHAGYHKPLYAIPYFRKNGFADFSLPNVEKVESEIVVINPLDDDR